MNVTLSLDDQLVKKVRKIAAERDTTLTGLVRALETLATEESTSERKKRELEALERSFKKYQFIGAREPGLAPTFMSDLQFLDVSVFVYAYERAAGNKQDTALGLSPEGLPGEILVSTQVLAEFGAPSAPESGRKT